MKPKLPLLNSVLIVLLYTVGYNYLFPELLKYAYGLGISTVTGYILQLAVYISVLLVTAALGWPLISHGWQKFADDPGKCLREILRSYARMIMVIIPISALIYFLTGSSSSANQEVIDYIKRQDFLFLAFASCLFAPVVEEMVFRGAIFNTADRYIGRVAAMILASFLFGFLHVFDSLFSGDYVDLLYILIYGALGFIINSTYVETDSIICAMILHMLNNAVALIV